MPKYVFGQQTPEQRAAALEKMMVARVARKDFLDKVRRGEANIADVLADADSGNQVALKMQVRSLLIALPEVRSARAADRLMEDIGIAPGRRVGGLGTRQRAELLERMSG
jgi:septum formation inhibitor-activating ATPase MinD